MSRSLYGLILIPRENRPTNRCTSFYKPFAPTLRSFLKDTIMAGKDACRRLCSTNRKPLPTGREQENFDQWGSFRVRLCMPHPILFRQHTVRCPRSTNWKAPFPRRHLRLASFPLARISNGPIRFARFVPPSLYSFLKTRLRVREMRRPSRQWQTVPSDQSVLRLCACQPTNRTARFTDCPILMSLRKKKQKKNNWVRETSADNGGKGPDSGKE